MTLTQFGIVVTFTEYKRLIIIITRIMKAHAYETSRDSND